MEIEIYRSGTEALIAHVNDGACPDVGEKISIRGQSWKVVSRSWAVDRADEHPAARALRVNLNCEPTDEIL